MTKQLSMLAFDFGASSGRAILGEYDGQKLNLQEIHTFPNEPQALNGHFYWDILRLFAEIKVGLKKAVQVTNGQLASVAIDTWGVDYGLLDKNDQLLSNPYHYRDERTTNLLPNIFANIPQDEVYRLTGNQFMQINTIVQLYADLKYRPWILQNAASLLFTPDLFNFFLTGKKHTEHTIASTSQLFDPEKTTWAQPIFATLNIPTELMQPLIFPGTVIGKILPDIAQECGVNKDVQVMAVGSHDTASAVAACPLTTQNSAYISCGTWSLLGMELEKPLINQAAFQENVTNEIGVGRTIRFLKNISGLWLLQQCRVSWQRAGLDLSWQEISDAAAKAPPFKFRVDPDDPRFLRPGDMPNTIIEYCQETNQTIPGNYGEMARGIYESLAFCYHEALTKLESLVGRHVDTVHIVGGGAQAELLCQLTADITGKGVVTGPIEATAMGNILGQLMAHGIINNLSEGRDLVRSSVQLKYYTK